MRCDSRRCRSVTFVPNMGTSQYSFCPFSMRVPPVFHTVTRPPSTVANSGFRGCLPVVENATVCWLENPANVCDSMNCT